MAGFNLGLLQIQLNNNYCLYSFLSHSQNIPCTGNPIHYTICNKNVVIHHPWAWIDTYGFPLLLLFNVGAAIPDKYIVTLAECQVYHLSSPPPQSPPPKVLLLYELQNIPPTICDKNVDPCSMLVLWGIFCYSNNNCTFLTNIEWGGGGGGRGQRCYS